MNASRKEPEFSTVAELVGPNAEVAGRGMLVRTFDSLADREFRWFYVSMLGQMASINMQILVRGYLAFVLTGSYAMLGVIALAGAIPVLVFSVFGGVAADRFPKKTILQTGQLLSVVNALVVAALVFGELMRIEWLIVSGIVQGTVMSLTLPTRQAMIPDIVGASRLMNALSLNTAGMNTTRIFSPAAGGFIVALVGFGWAFLAVAALYGIAFLAQSRVTWRPATAPVESGVRRLAAARSGVADIAHGVRYVARDRLLAAILGVSFISAIFALPYVFLLPGYVADVFDGGGTELGVMISMSAVGSLAGALVLASRPARRRGLTLLGGLVTIAIGLVAFAQTANYWTAAGLMVIVGVGTALYQVLSQGLLHSYVDAAYRGRVMSLYLMQFSVMQFGTFLVGVLAESVGIRTAFVGLGAGLMLVAAAVFLFVPMLRRLE